MAIAFKLIILAQVIVLSAELVVNLKHAVLPGSIL